ncbi:hypothetical protein SLA2020_166670 [Shorea laevis]
MYLCFRRWFCASFLCLLFVLGTVSISSPTEESREQVARIGLWGPERSRSCAERGLPWVGFVVGVEGIRQGREGRVRDRGVALWGSTSQAYVQLSHGGVDIDGWAP